MVKTQRISVFKTLGLFFLIENYDLLGSFFTDLVKRNLLDVVLFE